MPRIEAELAERLESLISMHDRPVHGQRPSDSLASAVRVVCPRCAGSCIFPQYKHIYGGKCFKCDGRGYILRVG